MRVAKLGWDEIDDDVGIVSRETPIAGMQITHNRTGRIAKEVKQPIEAVTHRQTRTLHPREQFCVAWSVITSPRHQRQYLAPRTRFG